MALTPEDVVNKRFQPTKFREGYDQDEVDDFLDEVVGELRRLTSENDDLRQKLSASEQRVSELSRGGSAAPADEAAGTASDATDEESAPATGEHAAASEDASAEPDANKSEESSSDAEAAGEPAGTTASSVSAKDESADAPAATASTGDSDSNELAAAAAGSAGTADATGLITLAQRLHDEHVQKGQEKRDQLVAEAQTKASSMVEEAEKTKAETLSSLEEEKSMLERKIDRLRDFERQYRTRLKSYLQDQLRDLDSRGSLVPENLGDEPGQP